MNLPAPDQMHPTIRALYEHWRANHPADGALAGHLPGRQHFGPLDVPKLLPHVWLLDVAPPTDSGTLHRFRYRVIGSAIAQAGPPVKTGQWLHEAITDQQTLSRMTAFLVDVVERRQPAWRRGLPTVGHDRHVAALEAIVLPLARDGLAVDALLSATVFYLHPRDVRPPGDHGLGR